MKKPTLILILLIFAACAVGGYYAASKIKTNPSENASNSATVSAALASQQQNFLLVRVDDLSLPSPKLIEVWMVFTAYTNPPQIMFMPLYPAYDATLNSALLNAFGIDSQGNLSNRLVQEIKRQHNTVVNGYIMVDTQGMSALATWFGIKGVQADSIQANSDDEKHAILLNSQFFFQNICAQLKAGAAASQFASIRWSEIIPAHFHTDLSFEQLIASWDKINRGPVPQQCEVLSNE